MNLDLGKLAKGAAQELQKGKQSGNAVDAAKNLLHDVKEAASGKAPEQMLEALRKLVAEAKQLLKSSGQKNESLESAINKAEELLNSKEISAETVAKVTTELGALLKGSKTEHAESVAKPAAPAPRPAPSSATSKTPSSAPKQESSPAKPVQFSDVKADAYYYDAVQWAVQKGIVSGTSATTFSPDQNCTRSQAITILWRAEGSPAPKGQAVPFTDVQDGAFYAKAAAWAAERNIVTGKAFGGDDEVTRAQIVTFLYRNAGSPAVSTANDFSDVPSDAYYAKAVAWATKQNITSGTGKNTFSPDAVCTRGQIVTFLYKAKK